jgi:hypothetical protein
MVTEIQEVYRLQGVAISDKHIEVIVRQMLRWVKVEDPGDTAFLVEQQVDKFRFREENERAINSGGRPAVGRPLRFPVFSPLFELNRAKFRAMPDRPAPSSVVAVPGSLLPSLPSSPAPEAE